MGDNGGYICGESNQGGPADSSSWWKNFGSRGCCKAIRTPPGEIISLILLAQSFLIEGGRAQRNYNYHPREIRERKCAGEEIVGDTV